MDDQRKKADGVYYTPTFIVDFIISRTLGREQITNIKILDPACGTGNFLLAAYRFLIQLHERKFKRLSFEEKARILKNSIYGVDIDPTAVAATRSSLLQILNGKIDLEKNIKQGNSLISTDYKKELRSGKKFDWKLEFPEVFKVGKPGFDLVLGNPPYGAEIGKEERRYLARRFGSGTTDTAALMMLLARDLTKEGGKVGFIVPKPFIYSSNWKNARATLLDEIEELVDTGKVWKEVKLEQVIYFLNKGVKTKSYFSTKREGEDFFQEAKVSKSECRRFGFLINGISNPELKLGRKIALNSLPLGKLATNRRGAMLQGLLKESCCGRRAIGGKQLKRYRLEGQKGFIEIFPSKALVKPGSILVQNIIAHIANPSPHIKIAGLVVNKEISDQIVILDTVNQIENHSNLSSSYLLALLHSRLINWYIYSFIFGRAIRTMHFDAKVTDRIPIQIYNQDLHNKIVELVESPNRENYQEEIENLICDLYGLTKEEKRILLEV